MEILLVLLSAYALTFFFQQKATILRGKSAMIDRLLNCTFCVGFHTGWVVLLISKSNLIFQKSLNFSDMIVEIIVIGLASSAFSYFLDTLIRLMESQISYEE